MDNINILKQYILRNQELLVLIKPISLILLLDETKRELINVIKDYNNFRTSRGNTIRTGEDNYQQNLIDLVNEHYKLNIEEAENKIDSLNLTIHTLKLKMHFDNSDPIREEKSSYERRIEINWIFELIAIKNNRFKVTYFEIIKNIIFGELIRMNKSINEREIYLKLICDFEKNSNRWIKSWIDQELPDESFF